MARVLVTGGGGFIGRHLVAALRRRGDAVLAPSRAEWDLAASLVPTGWEMDHIFHLAAATGVEESCRQPTLFHRVNATGTAAVAELCRAGACSLTYVSAYCYGVPD